MVVVVEVREGGLIGSYPLLWLDGPEPYARAAFAASVETGFFINCIIAPYLNGEQERMAQSSMDKLRVMGMDVEDEEDDHDVTEYTIDYLKNASKVYLSSLTVQ